MRKFLPFFQSNHNNNKSHWKNYLSENPKKTLTWCEIWVNFFKRKSGKNRVKEKLWWLAQKDTKIKHVTTMKWVWDCRVKYSIKDRHNHPLHSTNELHSNVNSNIIEWKKEKNFVYGWK